MTTATLDDILTGHVPVTSNRRLIESITSARESRFLAVVLAPEVKLTAEIAPPLIEVLDTMPEGGGLDLFVDTLGGAAEEAWRLVSILRERFDRYTAVVPFGASPGATQVALGANELMMGDASSLSPIEPARLRVLETTDGGKLPLSAYDVGHYLRFLRRAFEGGTIPEAATADLWNHVDPLVVGATERQHRSNIETTRRCLATHLDEAGVARVIESIDGLTHRFPLTRRDCESRLGLSVLKPTRDLWAHVWSLYEYYDRMLNLSGEMNLGDQSYAVDYDGFIDSADERRVLIRVTRLDERGHPAADRAPIRRWVRPVSREVKVDEQLEL